MPFFVLRLKVVFWKINMESIYSIYKITNKMTNKSYIGYSQNYKDKSVTISGTIKRGKFAGMQITRSPII